MCDWSPTSDGLTGLVEHRADLGSKEDESDDSDHGDEREDQSVFGQSLAFVVVADGRDECIKLRHVGSYLLSWKSRGMAARSWNPKGRRPSLSRPIANRRCIQKTRPSPEMKDRRPLR